MVRLAYRPDAVHHSFLPQSILSRQVSRPMCRSETASMRSPCIELTESMAIVERLLYADSAVAFSSERRRYSLECT